MATIRKRGLKWEAQVRRIGFPSKSSSFIAKTDALAWARAREREMDGKTAGTLQQRTDSSEVYSPPRILREVLERYLSDITAKKRGAASENYRVRSLITNVIASIDVSVLAGSDVAAYRDSRLQLVAPATVRRELTILRHAIEIARREWNFPIVTNAVKHIAIPSDSNHRERRLTEDEAGRIRDASRASPPYLTQFIALLIATGMRRGELLSVKWTDIDFDGRTIRIAQTKTGRPRTIPLSRSATSLLLEVDRKGERIFSQTANAVRLAWERLKKRANIEDLRMHDLRHEAISRFFELGLNIPEVALISGHRDFRMLARYTHLKPQNISAKLDRLEMVLDKKSN